MGVRVAMSSLGTRIRQYFGFSGRHRPETAVDRARPVRTVILLAAGLATLVGSGITGPPAALAAPGPLAARAALAAPTEATTAAGSFTVGMLNDVDSLNPFTGIVAESREVWQTMYDTLTVASAKDFSPVPSLATKWTTTADGLTWTYSIRAGVKWSDGVPLTAKDVAYTFNRVMKGTYEQTNYGSYVAGITSVTAPNDTTVVMKTRTPNPLMLRLAIPILPAHIWSKVSSEQVKVYRNEVGAVGSGPFVLTERKAGQSLRLTANKNYWGGAPKIDGLVYRVYGNSDALAQALQAGEIDFADNLDTGAWQSLRNVPGIKTHAASYSGFDKLTFNTGAALKDGTPIGDGNPALKDKSVRQALSYAINRDAIVQRTLKGNGTVGTTVIPPIYSTLHLDPATPYTFNLNQAGRILDVAGYRKGLNGKRRTPDGDPFTLRMFVRSESPSSQQAGRMIQGWFGSLGIPVTLRVITEDLLTERIGQGTFDMFEWGWLVDPDPDYQLSTFTCAERSYQDGGPVYANLSDSFYCNPRYDRLYAKQARQIDPVQRAATVRKMQQLLYDDAPYAVLYNYDNLQAYSTKFTGFVNQPDPDGVLLFQSGTWSYLGIKPVAATGGRAPTGPDDGSAVPLIAIGGGVVVAAVLSALIWRRRRVGLGEGQAERFDSEV
jgi:peptide/nickel transport system substrate-binding protein